MVMPLEYNQNLTRPARELRKAMTPQERKLWYEFLTKLPVRFRRQKPIGNFIADFYCDTAKLVIELDGAQHHTEQGMEYDAERDAYLKGLGLMVLRFTNQNIDYDFAKTCKTIQTFLTPPPPSRCVTSPKATPTATPLGVPPPPRGRHQPTELK